MNLIRSRRSEGGEAAVNLLTRRRSRDRGAVYPLTRSRRRGRGSTKSMEGDGRRREGRGGNLCGEYVGLFGRFLSNNYLDKKFQKSARITNILVSVSFISGDMIEINLWD